MIKRLFFITSLLLYSSILAAPTHDYLHKIPLEKIEKELPLDRAEWLKFHPLFSKMLLEESDHCIGYHASTQSYRLYQDIIRTVVEEIVGISLKEQFHFLRIPGDPTYCQPLDAFTQILSDREHTHSNQLLSLNISLFGNYSNHQESSLNYFLNNCSYTPSEKLYIKTLEKWFTELGIDPNEASHLFLQGIKKINAKGGILLKFSLKDSQFLDNNAYVSQSLGIPIPNTQPSKLLQEKRFFNGEQLRLLINNTTTLNPYSPLLITRYDLLTGENANALTKLLSKSVQQLLYDQEKVTAYKKKLLSYWKTME